MSALDTLEKLARLLADQRLSPMKPVFWLGAGCSVCDGVPLNDDLLRLTVPPDPNAWGSLQFRFDEYCAVLGSGVNRAAFLAPHFIRTITAASPYHGLVQLLDRGYADIVFTFNIDDLLEQALQHAGMREGTDYVLVNVPIVHAHVAVQQISSAMAPRIRIVKLHGDQQWGFNCMTSAEIVKFQPAIEAVVGEYSKRPAVVCGYSFFHLNVLNAFSSDGGNGPLFYVNKSFPDSPMVLSLMSVRSRGPFFIDRPLGCFDTFIAELLRRLP